LQTDLMWKATAYLLTLVARTHTVWRDILLILLSFSLLVDGHQCMNHHSSLS